MKKKQVLSALIAGTLAAMVFTGCGEDGNIPQDNNKDNPSNPVSDTGNGIGDVVSDVGEGMSDLGEDVSDGVNDMTGGNDLNNNKDNNKDNNNQDESRWEDKNSSNNGVNDPALNDDSVSALEPVETQKKTSA